MNLHSRGSRTWEKAGARYKYLFINKLVLRRGAKLGCEATFSPDLNLCHLDSCLVGGKGRRLRERAPESGEGLRGARPAAAAAAGDLYSISCWLPVSVFQEQGFPHSA